MLPALRIYIKCLLVFRQNYPEFAQMRSKLLVCVLHDKLTAYQNARDQTRPGFDKQMATDQTTSYLMTSELKTNTVLVRADPCPSHGL